MPGLRTTLLSLLLALALGLAWLVSTTDGARWLAQRASAWVPELNVTVLGGNLWEGVQLADVRWQSDVAQLRAKALTLNWDPWCVLRGEHCVMALQGEALKLNEHSLGELRLALAGNAASHRIDLTLDGGVLPLRLALQGGIEAAPRRWQGQLIDGVVGAKPQRWQLIETPELQLEWRSRSLSLAPHCWANEAINLCVNAASVSPRAAELALDLRSMPMQRLAAYWPEGVRVNGYLSATANLAWQAGGTPRARLTVVSPDGELRLARPEGQSDLPLRYRRLVLDADLRPDRADLRLGMASPDIGNGGFAVHTDPLAAERPLAGIVWLEGVSLAPLAGLLPEISQINGAIAARGEVAGTLRQPRFNGELAIVDTTLLPRALAAPIEAIDLVARVAGDEAAIDGQYRLGAGQGQVNGTLSLAEGSLNGSLALTGEELELRPGAVTQITVDPNLKLEVMPSGLALSGRLDIPSAEITLGSGVGSGAVRTSPDAVRVDARGEPLQAVEGDSNRGLQSDLRLVFGERVNIKAQGLTGRLTGELFLRQAIGADAKAQGVLELKDAQYSAYGQTLAVRRGRLIFAGPVENPRLDIEAVRESPDLLAGLRVAGTAQDPQLTLFSRPPMEQASVLSYLITGRPPGQGTPSQEALVGEAALALGVFGGSRIGGALAEEIGISDFQLEASGQGESAEVAVSGYLAPNLMLRYGVGVFEPENTLTLRYYLRPRLYLEAVSGAEGALDLFYSFDYD